MLPPFLDKGRDVALVDVDGDGDLDLFHANAIQTRLALNDGHGLFSDAPGYLPSGITAGEAARVADVDGDGDADILLSGRTLLINDGTGHFSAGGSLLPAGLGPLNQAAFGDVDGDGDLDLLATYGGGWTTVKLLVNQGGGFFVDSPGQIPSLTGWLWEPTFGDIDGDLDLDAFIAGSNGHARLLLNDGSGNLQDVTNTHLPTSMESSSSVLEDVDGDGDLDLLVSGLQVLQLPRNDGQGIFTEVAGAFPPATYLVRKVRCADLDADGDLDAFTVGHRHVETFLNDGTGIFAPGPPGLPPELADVRGLALGDVDGDGDIDVLTADHGGGVRIRNRMYLNDGSGTFTDVTSPLPVEVDDTRAADLVDLDGDGDLDAVIGNDFTNRLSVFLNSGAGWYRRGTGSLTHPAGVRGMTFGDVDGDGDPDCVIAGFYSCALKLNNGDGTFTDASSQLPPAGAYAAFDVALADVDGNGTLDILAAQGGLSLWINNGSGVFADATALVHGVGTPPRRPLLVIDSEGDGDPDVVTGAALYINDGTGSFWDFTALLMPPPAPFTRFFAAGDVTGNGTPDLLYSAFGTPGLLVNNGISIYSDASNQLPPTFTNIGPNASSATLDVDLDGDLDFYLAQSVADFLLLNDGSGNFVLGSSSIPPDIGWSWDVASGDVDGDGDDDILAGNAGESVLYTNLTRQLSWSAPLRFGKPFTLELRGPPLQTWSLYAAATRWNLPLPPHGTLFLSLNNILPLGQGLLDSQGAASITFQIPPDPGGFTGFQIHTQALLGGTLPHLSNLEVLVTTDL